MTKEQKELTDKFCDEFKKLLHRDTLEARIDISIFPQGTKVDYNHESYRIATEYKKGK